MMLKKLLQLLVFVGILATSAVYAGDKININKADAANLAKELTGIGDKLAEAIVTYRKQHGDFKNVAEITNIKGIGEGTLKKNFDRMTVGDDEAESKPKATDATNKDEKDKPKDAAKAKDVKAEEKKSGDNADDDSDNDDDADDDSDENEDKKK
jgi:competence protein ComEA